MITGGGGCDLGVIVCVSVCLMVFGRDFGFRYDLFRYLHEASMCDSGI